MRILSFFLFLFACSISHAQSSDCSGAIQICGDGSISSNANGAGVQEISELNSCSSRENNSLWLYIEITKAGTLGFDLKPVSSNLEVDYDFFIFGPNASCGNLGQSIRCSTTNPLASGATTNLTGMRPGETDTSEGPGANGNNFIKPLDVLPGETYFIVIDRPIGDGPFELNWTGDVTDNGTPFPEGPEIEKPGDLSTCNASGQASFDLSVQESEITSQVNTTLSFHTNLADATDNIQPIQGSYLSNEPVKTIYARVENDLTGCAEITDFELIIEDGPVITPEYDFAQCDLDFDGAENFRFSDIDSEILNGLDPNQFEIAYFLEPNQARDNINPLPANLSSEGETIYARVWEKGFPNCYNISEISLNLNIPPQLQDFDLVQPVVNSNNNSISINLQNSGNYEYSIGNIDGPYQEETEFRNISSGFQTLYIRDKNGCAIISTEIAIIGYDNFFTPNNDGINDFWQIRGIDEPAAANFVSIFDRYGKLLKKLHVSEKGWDGTFNGQEMPSDDYWFRLSLRNRQEVTGHFSLIR
ncbi:T9SS type B sorting domain-containing protein [Gramella sp. GC03-9]|uniref:T9SS type B sorting domain-containing protein n=1 Tax=Christiangramia oceanisediminis TaxID=2920386 RepID=A0A9X2R9U9_9FLAO|nr:T9SS type B sorting domain-containing protein [Gramella oceanisediminis]MCP9201097.1 T9SS type B sorting domain-containing protein [Gramella oceanisediminis]